MGFGIYTDDFDGLFDISFDEIAEQGLKEAAPVLVDSLKSAMKSVIEHPGESEMVDSVRLKSIEKSKNGAWIANAGPSGYSKDKVYQHKKSKRKYPVSNALKAIWKEYGIAGRQPAKPFLAKATNDAEKEVLEMMQKAFDEKVKPWT